MSLRRKIATIIVPAALLAAPSAMAQTTTGFAEFVARIGTNGTITRGSGVTSAARISSSVYTVTFPRDVSACYVLVTVVGQPGFATANQTPTELTQVSVSTFDQNGKADKRNFFILVRCQD